VPQQGQTVLEFARGRWSKEIVDMLSYIQVDQTWYF
jgi:hypothetical protein